ncbi:MAG: hypothetical protein R6V55_08685 [Desulfovermiculus sp.]
MSTPEKTDHYLDIKVGINRYRRLYFKDEEEKKLWYRMHKKSKLYIPYFLVGVAINFGLYFSGVDLSRDILMGSLVGMGVPLCSMFLLSEIHFRVRHSLKNGCMQF